MSAWIRARNPEARQFLLTAAAVYTELPRTHPGEAELPVGLQYKLLGSSFGLRSGRGREVVLCEHGCSCCKPVDKEEGRFLKSEGLPGRSQLGNEFNLQLGCF